MLLVSLEGGVEANARGAPHRMATPVAGLQQVQQAAKSTCRRQDKATADIGQGVLDDVGAYQRLALSLANGFTEITRITHRCILKSFSTGYLNSLDGDYAI